MANTGLNEFSTHLGAMLKTNFIRNKLILVSDYYITFFEKFNMGD
jgi:hypothetical protein